MIYLDNNATTKPSDAAIAAAEIGMREAWENPSSVHRAGQNARAKVELARKSIAELIGCKPREITFTSSGTESIHLAIRGAVAAHARKDVPPLVVSSKVEHSAVRDLLPEMEARGEARVRWLAVDRAGAIELDSLHTALEERPAIVSVQWINNETGAVQPVFEIADLCNASGVPFHCDAVQWVGKEPLQATPSAGKPDDPRPLNASFITLSAHKFHGLKGVGCLFSRMGTRLRPQTPGSQELGKRAGTENVPGILAAGAAADESRRWLADPRPRNALATLRDRFERQILESCPGAIVNGVLPGHERIWNTTSIGFPKLQAEAILLALSERGVCASAGAACASGSLDPSPVLLAMGVPPDVAHGTLRFSLSRHTTERELNDAAGIIAQCVRSLRQTTAAVV